MAASHRYSIRPLDPAAHLYEVRVTVAEPNPDGQAFFVPAWIPGSYMIRDYARHIVAARAESDGVGVALQKVDKSTWQAQRVERELTLVLEIFAHDDSVRGAHLDTTHAYFNGTCVFPCVVGQENVRCDLEILNAEIQQAKGWRVATAMRPTSAERYGFGGYTADDYAELIDHPVEIGDLAIGEFDAGGVPHAIAIRGNTKTDMARLTHDLQTLCEQHMSLLGKPRDLDRYVFLLHAPGNGYGGLEHRWSSSNVCSRDNLPVKGAAGVSEGYRTLLGLLSHEYFHLWNVKRMKPAAFSPYELATESHTTLLWVFEGITSYYDDLALVRSGLIDLASYLELLGQTITRVVRGAGRRRQSVSESSFDAWTKFYKQDANAQNAIVSYYAKGAMIALTLDLKLRSETDGRVSLDDVMRACWKKWGESADGMPEGGFEATCGEVSGLDLDDFFDAAVRGTGELPLESLLKTHGIEYQLRASSGRTDKGGTKGEPDKLPSVWLGATLAVQSGNTVFASVANGGSAELAGVSPGDEFVALDGVRIGAADSDTRVRSYRPNDKSTLSVFRGDELLTLHLTWQPAPADTCYLEPDTTDDAVVERRDRWLSG